jgi:hypothetical protein
MLDLALHGQHEENDEVQKKDWPEEGNVEQTFQAMFPIGTCCVKIFICKLIAQS